jgi:hypothetical protein
MRPPRPTRTGSSGRSAAAIACAVALCGISPAAAQAAGGGDVAASARYVQADYHLISSAVAKLPTAKAAIAGVLRGVQSTCPHAAAGSPQDPMSTQLSNEVIGSLVLAVVQRGIGVARRFVGEAGGLRWSDRQLTRQVGEYVAHVRTLSQLAPPPLCTDVRSWASSGFQTLPATTTSFDVRFMPAWVGAGELPARLSRYEDAATRALERRARVLEERFIDFESQAVETWSEVMSALSLWP